MKIYKREMSMWKTLGRLLPAGSYRTGRNDDISRKIVLGAFLVPNSHLHAFHSQLLGLGKDPNAEVLEEFIVKLPECRRHIEINVLVRFRDDRFPSLLGRDLCHSKLALADTENDPVPYITGL